jgi:hypothetical protein
VVGLNGGKLSGGGAAFEILAKTLPFRIPYFVCGQRARLESTDSEETAVSDALPNPSRSPIKVFRPGALADYPQAKSLEGLDSGLENGVIVAETGVYKESWYRTSELSPHARTSTTVKQAEMWQ